MTQLRLPALSASPRRLRRLGMTWLKRSGDDVAAREPVAACYLRLSESGASNRPMPLRDEQNDLQAVLAPAEPCTVALREKFSKAGDQAHVEAGDWQSGEGIADAASLSGSGILSVLLLAGRRGLETGEGRGACLPDGTNACEATGKAMAMAASVRCSPWVPASRPRFFAATTSPFSPGSPARPGQRRSWPCRMVDACTPRPSSYSIYGAHPPKQRRSPRLSMRGSVSA